MPERTKYLIQVAAETAGAVIVAIAIFFAAREVSIPFREIVRIIL